MSITKSELIKKIEHYPDNMQIVVNVELDTDELNIFEINSINCEHYEGKDTIIINV